jgi:hypothetical protein
MPVPTWGVVSAEQPDRFEVEQGADSDSSTQQPTVVAARFDFGCGRRCGLFPVAHGCRRDRCEAEFLPGGRRRWLAERPDIEEGDKLAVEGWVACIWLGELKGEHLTPTAGRQLAGRPVTPPTKARVRSRAKSLTPHTTHDTRHETRRAHNVTQHIESRMRGMLKVWQRRRGLRTPRGDRGQPLLQQCHPKRAVHAQP